MSGKYYMKPFSKDWWRNYWYYYKWPTVVGIIVVLALILLISQLPFFQPRADFAFMYAGNIKGMGSTDGYELERRFSTVVSDIDGDGKYHVTSDVIYIEESEAGSVESPMGIVLDSTVAAGEHTVFFSSEYMLRRFDAENNMYDLTALAEKYNIPEEKLRRTESGKVFAISIADNKIFENLPEENDLSEVYILVRDLRYNDQSNYKKNLHAHGVEMAEYIISNGTYVPERKTYSIN